MVARLVKFRQLGRSTLRSTARAALRCSAGADGAMTTAQVAGQGRENPGDISGAAFWIEDPGIAEGAAADHHRITAGFFHHLQAILVTEDIAVTDDRDRDGIFYFCDHRAVDGAAEAITPGATMHSYGRGACVFGHFGELGAGDLVVGPAGPELYRYRQ